MPPEETAQLRHDEMAATLYAEPEPEPGQMPEPTGEAETTGEFPSSETPPADPPPAEAAPEGEVTAEPEATEPETTGEFPSSEDEPAGEVEEVEVQTFSQLAEHLETEPEWLEGLTIEQTVRGETVQVKIADALETYRKVEAADSYLKEAKEKAAGMVEETATRKQELGDAVAGFAAMVEYLETSIASANKDTDWDRLRREDPAEYAARKEEQKERNEMIQTLKAEGAAKYREALQTITQQSEQRREEALPAEQAALFERVPEWQDQKKAEKEVTDVIEYLRNDGFSDEHIKVATYNGRLMALATKAMRYDRAKSNSQVAKKKVTKIPKVLRPGSKQVETAPNPTADPNDRVAILYGK